MNQTASLDRSPADRAPAAASAPRIKDDATMLKAAATLTRELNVPNARIYWADMLGSAVLGYAALFAAIALHGAAAFVAGGVAAPGPFFPRPVSPPPTPIQ